MTSRVAASHTETQKHTFSEFYVIQIYLPTIETEILSVPNSHFLVTPRSSSPYADVLLASVLCAMGSVHCWAMAT